MNPKQIKIRQLPRLLYGQGHSFTEETITIAADTIYPYGTIMGLNAATNKLVPFKSDVANMPPLFFVINEEGIDATTSNTCRVLSSGGIYSGAINFTKDTDNLDTVYDGKRVSDYLRDKFVIYEPLDIDVVC